MFAEQFHVEVAVLVDPLLVDLHGDGADQSKATGQLGSDRSRCRQKWVVQTDQYQDFDSALEAIATQNNFMNREPAHAVAWATSIFDAELRLKTMDTVLHHWSHADREAATAYLTNSREFTPE